MKSYQSFILIKCIERLLDWQNFNWNSILVWYQISVVEKISGQKSLQCKKYVREKNVLTMNWINFSLELEYSICAIPICEKISLEFYSSDFKIIFYRIALLAVQYIISIHDFCSWKRTSRWQCFVLWQVIFFSFKDSSLTLVLKDNQFPMHLHSWCISRFCSCYINMGIKLLLKILELILLSGAVKRIFAICRYLAMTTQIAEPGNAAAICKQQDVGLSPAPSP